MSNVISVEEFRKLTKGKQVIVLPHREVEKMVSRRAHNPEVAGSSPALATNSQRKPDEIERSVGRVASVQDHLRAMGHYFDLPEKSVKFYIAQFELSKKL